MLTVVLPRSRCSPDASLYPVAGEGSGRRWRIVMLALVVFADRPQHWLKAEGGAS